MGIKRKEDNKDVELGSARKSPGLSQSKSSRENRGIGTKRIKSARGERGHLQQKDPEEDEEEDNLEEIDDNLEEDEQIDKGLPGSNKPYLKRKTKGYAIKNKVLYIYIYIYRLNGKYQAVQTAGT